MQIIVQALSHLRRDERGASAVEYAILVGIVGVAIAGGAHTFGTSLSTYFGGLMNTVTAAAG